MQHPPAPLAAPVHRLAPAMRTFFGHSPRDPIAQSWPAPLRALAQRIVNLIDPPLEPMQLQPLLQLLTSDAEQAVVNRWRALGTLLRESDRRVIEAYLLATADYRQELSVVLAELEVLLEQGGTEAARR